MKPAPVTQEEQKHAARFAEQLRKSLEMNRAERRARGFRGPRAEIEKVLARAELMAEGIRPE
jgi:hypothetical protein